LQRGSCSAGQPLAPGVSIPYFAGRPLQPPIVPGWSADAAAGFNPLLRGAAFATVLTV